MPVPKTAMNKDHSPVLWENQIRLAWNVLDIQAVAEAAPMQCFTQNPFRLGVLAPNCGHNAGPRRLVDDICQGAEK